MIDLGPIARDVPADRARRAPREPDAGSSDSGSGPSQSAHARHRRGHQAGAPLEKRAGRRARSPGAAKTRRCPPSGRDIQGDEGEPRCKAVERETDDRRAAPVATPPRHAATGTDARAAPPPRQQEIALQGNRLDVTVEQNGKVVAPGRTRRSICRTLLMTVFSTTPRDQGEVPFAVGKDGRIYTPTRRATAKTSPANGRRQRRARRPTVDGRLDRRHDQRSDRLRAAARASRVRSATRRPRSATPRRATRPWVAVHRSRDCRHRAAVRPAHAQPVDAHRRRRSDRAGRLQRARAAQVEDEIGQLASAFNQMAADVERASARGGRAGANQARARTRAADSARHAAARAAAPRAHARSTASRCPRVKSAATSSTTSRWPTARSRCSWATCRAKASARRC